MDDSNIEVRWAMSEWAAPPDPRQLMQMQDALQDAGLDAAETDAVVDYLGDPVNGFSLNWESYSAQPLEAMFRARAVEYGEGYYKVGREYLEEHYGKGLEGDSMVGLTAEQVKQVGVNVAGSEHEVARYFWFEADDGRVWSIVRPEHATDETLS